MTNKIPISSSELGNLWMAYFKDEMMSRFLDCFLIQTDDEAAKNIMTTYYNNINNLANEVEQKFLNEGAVIPIAFQENDVRKDAPPLFDSMFGMMFLRTILKVTTGFHALHLGMSYRHDIMDFQKRSYINSMETFIASSDYLIEKGVLARPPYVSMPKEAEFVEDTKYMKGIMLFGDKRSLNTIEVAHIYNTIESNIFGTQLMTGFAQVAKESEVSNYFIKGKELAKKIVSNLSEVMQQSDIQPPATWIGRATDSTVSPFSDKMMMFCTSLLSSFGLGSNALGTAFSLRSDLPLKLTVIMKDTFQFASKGGQIMIKHKWLEEPPQMEDRNRLIKAK
jgi:hypothetical protein